MAITQKQSEPLRKRLRSLPFAEDEALRIEAGKALERHASDVDHARRITDFLMEKMHRYPVPADVIEAANATRKAEQSYYDAARFLEPPKCAACGDSGFVIVRRGEYEAAKPCDCRKRGAA